MLSRSVALADSLRTDGAVHFGDRATHYEICVDEGSNAVHMNEEDMKMAF